jgi:integrase
MPKEKRNYFRINGIRARWRKKPNGVFEIRCTIGGEKYYGASRDLQTAKKKFIKALKRETPKQEEPQQDVKRIPTVEEYAYHYLDTFKKNNICEKAYNNYCGIVKRHIVPHFTNKLITEITASSCQALLNKIIEEGKYRTSEDINNLLKWISLAAVCDGYFIKSPMETVVVLKYARQNGKCIPLELMREKVLIEPKEKYDYLIWFAAYVGLRPCEHKQVQFESDNFIIIENGKRRKNQERTYRRIPIHSALKPYLGTIKELLTTVQVGEVSKYFRKKGLIGYKFKDLRHTFTTFIQEGGANEKWVDYVTNHVGAQNVTQKVYTHWSDAFQLEQIEKLKY